MCAILSVISPHHHYSSWKQFCQYVLRFLSFLFIAWARAFLGTKTMKEMFPLQTLLGTWLSSVTLAPWWLKSRTLKGRAPSFLFGVWRIQTWVRALQGLTFRNTAIGWVLKLGHMIPFISDFCNVWEDSSICTLLRERKEPFTWWERSLFGDVLVISLMLL